MALVDLERPPILAQMPPGDSRGVDARLHAVEAVGALADRTDEREERVAMTDVEVNDGYSETWTCARCQREITVPDDPQSASWEVVNVGESDDPEDWPVFCPDCLTNRELAEIVRQTAEERA